MWQEVQNVADASSDMWQGMFVAVFVGSAARRMRHDVQIGTSATWSEAKNMHSVIADDGRMLIKVLKLGNGKVI